jgi:hypothetical protein
MKKILPLLLSLALGTPLLADPASHRKAAETLIAAVAGPELVKSGFNSSLTPMFQNMRQSGAPEAMIVEFQAALEEWFNTEIKWDDLLPLMTNLYVEAYTESELVGINEFIKTPIGQKMMKNTPELMQKGMVIGQQYATTKQASLQKKLQEISARYQAKAAAPSDAVIK